MATYSTSFGEYTTGVNLSDWTDYWGTADFTYKAETNSGTYKVGTKWCDFAAAATSRKALTWDDIGSVNDTDILVRYRMGALISSGPRLYARVGGTTANEDCYFFGISPSTLFIHKYVAGVSTSVSTTGFTAFANFNYWMRFRVNGTSLKGKVWSQDCVEPDDWTIETTDSDLSSGYAGIGNLHYNDDFKCDFFECVTGGGSATYPPSSFDYNDSFSSTTMGISNTAYVDFARSMGGQFIDSGRYLKGVGVYCRLTHADQVRVAVYSGGALATGPSGATLLKDFGETSGAAVDDYIDIFTTDTIAIPQNAPLWIVVKGNNASGFRTICESNVTHCGDYQIARGRGDVTAIIGKDPTVAFASTFPAGTTTFTGSVYAFKIYLDGHPDVPPDPGANGTVTITGNGPLTCTGWSNAQSGSVGVTAGGDLTCIGTSVAGGGTVTITAGGDVLLAGLSGRLGTVGITGNGNLTFPHKAWGSVGITAGGALNFTAKAEKTGVVTIEGNGLLVGAYLKNQFIEEVWLDSKLVQGVLGASPLRRVDCGY